MYVTGEFNLNLSKYGLFHWISGQIYHQTIIAFQYYLKNCHVVIVRNSLAWNIFSFICIIFFTLILRIIGKDEAIEDRSRMKKIKETHHFVNISDVNPLSPTRALAARFHFTQIVLNLDCLESVKSIHWAKLHFKFSIPDFLLRTSCFTILKILI